MGPWPTYGTAGGTVQTGASGALVAHPLRDTQPSMPELSTTPDLVELVRLFVEAFARREFDSAMSICAPDAVWDNSTVGLGAFEGTAAIRSFLEDWIGSYEEFEQEIQELTDLGNGVTFGVLIQRGRLAGSTGVAHLRYAAVTQWRDGLITRNTQYTDIDEARAAAERPAESMG